MKKVSVRFFFGIVAVLLFGILCGCAVSTAPSAQPTSTLTTQTARIPSVETLDPGIQQSIDVVVGGAVPSGGCLWLFGTRAQALGNTVYPLVSVRSDGSDPDDRLLFFSTNILIDGERDYNDPEISPRVRIALRVIDIGEQTPCVYWQELYMEDTENGREVRKTVDRLGRFDASSASAEGWMLETGSHFRDKVFEDKTLQYITSSAGMVWFELCGAADAAQPHILAGVSAEDASCKFSVKLPEGKLCRSAQPLAGDRLLVHLQDVLAADAAGGGQGDQFFVLDLSQPFPKLGEPLPFPAELLTDGSVRLLGCDVGDLPECAGVFGAGGVWLWDIDTGAFSLLYSADSMGINATLLKGMDEAVLFGDGTLCVPYQQDYTQPFRLRMFRPSDGVQADDRQVITVGGGSIDENLRQAVERFNLANTELRVKLLDYSDAAAAEAGFASGIDMLSRQLIRGEGPDVVLLRTAMDTGGLLNKGIFADLYPYIDADPELSRDDLIANVLAACELDGELSLFAPAFGIVTAVGSRQKLGDGMGWTVEEFAAATAGMTTPYYGRSRSILLWNQLQINSDRFIDYTAMEARLEDPAFIRLLEDSSRYPADVDFSDNVKQMMDNGETLLYIVSMSNLNMIPVLEYYFDGPFVYKGFPTEDGSVGSMFSAQYQVGIRDNSPNRDAAWAFVRTLLLPEFQDSLTEITPYQLPLRRDSMQKLLEKEKGVRRYGSIPQGVAVPLTKEQSDYFNRSITQEEIDAFLALIGATDTLLRSDYSAYSIVTEEAQAYYDGMRTAAEATAIMQNRVQTYLDEQG